MLTWALLLAAGLLTACSQDELAEQAGILPEGKYPLQIGNVSITADVDGQPWTRVGESDDRNSSHWDDGNKIKVQIAEGTPGTYTYQDGSLIVAEGDVPAYWASKDDAQLIRAWHTSSGSETVELGNQTEELAYVLTAQATAKFNEPVSLAFGHVLAKVRVVLEGDKKDDVTDVKIKTYTSCTLGKGGTLTASGTEDFIPMVETTYNNGETCWEANVVPSQEIKQIMMNENESILTTSLIPQVARVNTITLTVNKGPLQPGEDGKFTIDGGDVTIKDYNGTAPIVVNGDATITIRNVKLETTGDVMTINNGVNVTLNIEGTDNEFTSTTGAGIKIMGTNNASRRGNITINGKGTGNTKLKITAKDGAAVGFRMVGDGNVIYCGDININDITLEATGGSGSPAIGISKLKEDWYDVQKQYGNISISGSEITAFSSGNAACIGTPDHSTSSPFSLGVILIENSTVTATADGNQAACIGFGCASSTAGGFKKVIQKIEFNQAILHLNTGATNKVGFGAGDESRQLTEGIWNNGNKVGDTGWNP